MELAITVAGQTKNAGTLTVSDANFARKFNESLVHQVVTAYMAYARAGTHAQKNRSAVRGGGKKPWRQKGTGQARAGTIRSPLWRGGGVTFAATTQDYSQKVNKKMYRQAIRSILSELLRQERLIVVDSLEVAECKTKAMLVLLDKLGLVNKPTLIVTEALDDKLYLAGRNLHYILMTDVLGINPVNLVGYEKVVMTKAAVALLEERLS